MKNLAFREVFFRHRGIGSGCPSVNIRQPTGRTPRRHKQQQIQRFKALLRRLGLFGYAASGLLVLLMAWALYGTTGAATQTAARVDFILEILAQLDGVNESMARAEAAQRGYLLYNEERFVIDRDHEIASAR